MNNNNINHNNHSNNSNNGTKATEPNVGGSATKERKRKRKIDNNSNSGNNPINNNSSPVPPSSNQFQTINSSNGEAGSNKNFKWDYPPTNLNSQPQQVSSSVKKVRVESFLSTWIIHISPRRAWVLVFSFWGIWVWVWSEMYICKAFIFVNHLQIDCAFIL